MKKCLFVLAALVLPVPVASAQEIRKGIYNDKPVVYEVVDGMGIVDGDIILGTPRQLSRSLDEPRDTSPTSNPERLWGKEGYFAIIPYTIEPGLASRETIFSAIRHWEEVTMIRFRERISELDYLHFTASRSRPELCASWIGRQGGRQEVWIGSECSLPAAVHEIGHAVGLWHEHQRPDRDQHIRILWENVAQGSFHNFDLDLLDAAPQDPYDYGSIMHYGPYVFSKNGNPTMETVPPGIEIGRVYGFQYDLSRQDVYGVHELYDSAITEWTTIATNPPGAGLMIDGNPFYHGPQGFQWPLGSVHTIRPVDDVGPTDRRLFQKWSHGAPREFELVVSEDSPKVITAHFAEYGKFKSGVYENRGGRVVVVPHSPDGWYPQRTPMMAYAIPHEGWSFAWWSGVTYAPLHGYSGNPAYFHLTSINLNYEALFTNRPLIRIETNHPGRSILVDGTEEWLPTALPGQSGRRYDLELPDRIQYDRGPGLTRWVFREWSSCSFLCTSSTLQVRGSGRDKTYGVYFTKQHSLQLYSEPPGAGFLDSVPHSPDGFYDANSAVYLKATPRGALPFQGWLMQTPYGDLVSTDNPAVLVIDEPSLVEGVFFE